METLRNQGEGRRVTLRGELSDGGMRVRDTGVALSTLVTVSRASTPLISPTRVLTWSSSPSLRLFTYALSRYVPRPQIPRFLILDHYLHADSRPLFDPSRQQQANSAAVLHGQQLVPGGGADDAFVPPLLPPQQEEGFVKQEDLGGGPGPGVAAPPAPPQSRWTSVDEEEERQNAPQVGPWKHWHQSYRVLAVGRRVWSEPLWVCVAT